MEKEIELPVILVTSKNSFINYCDELNKEEVYTIFMYDDINNEYFLDIRIKHDMFDLDFFNIIQEIFLRRSKGTMINYITDEIYYYIKYNFKY
ncbi:hypothetical protein M0Q50_04765 [bacterium]|jgi:hypothetical protein|nr:hypothetical protein [bacterium]